MHACKVFLPKSSGLLRPYTLLTVDDQIVYQACVNVIAEKLYKRVNHRYRKTVFHHLYAGKTSIFFYRRWQDGYRQFNRSILKAVARGYDFAADFDLTAFYDTIDHYTLRYFLEQLRLDPDLIEFLLGCLRRWTSTTWTNHPNAIYHGHGIPQGPLSSGMLSECVLSHLDAKGTRGVGTRYFRYVDDIKLFSKSEGHLRKRLITLDLGCKEIGLFPQTSKVNIHRVFNPRKEIKTVSVVPNGWSSQAKQDFILRKLKKICRGGKLAAEDYTSFRYYLGAVRPHHTVNKYLVEILSVHPDLSKNISSYIARYKKLPRNFADQITRYIFSVDLYHAVLADLLLATLDNMIEPYRSAVANFCRERLVKKVTLPPQPTYKNALLAWALTERKLSHPEYTRLLGSEKDWWVRQKMIGRLASDYFGRASYEEILNEAVKDEHPEIARLAADRIFEKNIRLRGKPSEIAFPARVLLKTVGKIRSTGRPESRIREIMSYIVGKALFPFDWRKFLSHRHKHAETIAIFIKKYFETDIDACVVRLDSLCDLIFEELYRRLEPGKSYGNYGGMLNSPGAVIRTRLPVVCAGFKVLHQLRTKSATPHPRDKLGRPTKRLKHRDFYRVRPAVFRAFEEISLKITPTSKFQ